MALFSWILFRRRRFANRAIMSEPRPARTRPTKQRRVVIKRNQQPLYQERGWRKSRGTLCGYYRTKYGAFSGRIEQAFTASPTYFITDPPERLLSGPHGACFNAKSKGLYQVHWSDNPKDINAGILSLENCIRESLS